MDRVILKYDGKWDFKTGDQRQWTIQTIFIDADGFNRQWGSFDIEGLRSIGAVPAAKGNGHAQ